MKTALVISSNVAASRVGATATGFCLRRLGVETVILPTTLLGRHPGWGAPGGGPVDIETLRDMWVGIEAQNIKFDAVMTGYMATPEHVALARLIIGYVRNKNPNAIIMVDPVMGDHGRLYVNETIANRIMNSLIPIADVITPNLWEMGYISGLDLTNPKEIIASARLAAPSAVITSVTVDQKIGALGVTQTSAFTVSHEKFEQIPHGGGDALAGTLLAHLIKGDDFPDALAKSVASIFNVIKTAVSEDAGELPLVRSQDFLVNAAPLPLKAT